MAATAMREKRKEIAATILELCDAYATMKEVKIPFLNFEPMHQAAQGEMKSAFARVYASNWFINGAEVADFEKAFARFCQTDFAVGVSNGLDALHLCLRALGVQAGDEVIVPSNTFIATVLAVSYCGATPVFVEPRMDTFNIDPENIERAITKRTKVIIPVHLYGQPCEMDHIVAIASAHGLFVVEDNAQAHGATFLNKITGGLGHLNATSFYPGKNLGALGDGGAVTTDNSYLSEKVAMLRNYGSKEKYKHEYIGFNMRLDELQAAFLSVKLGFINEWTRQRQQIAEWYIEFLSDCPHIILPTTHENASHVYHLFVVRSNERDRLQEHLGDSGVATLIHYPTPPHLQAAYRHLGCAKGDFPVAEHLAETCLSLPIWPGMTIEQVQYVANQVIKFK